MMLLAVSLEKFKLWELSFQEDVQVGVEPTPPPRPATPPPPPALLFLQSVRCANYFSRLKLKHCGFPKQATAWESAATVWTAP